MLEFLLQLLKFLLFYVFFVCIAVMVIMLIGLGREAKETDESETDESSYAEFRNKRRNKTRNTISSAPYRSWLKRFDAKGYEPNDLLHLSLADTKELEFGDKRRLYHALEELREDGEWRHMGLLPELVKVSKASYSRSTDDYTYWLALNTQIIQTLEQTGENLFDIKDGLLCRNHFRRYIAYTRSNIRHAACPICKFPQYGLKIEKVIAVLDKRRSWLSLQQGNVLYVNYFSFGSMLDFDAVEIGRCTHDEIDEFIVSASNDPFIVGRKRRERSTYKVAKGIELEEKSRRNLDKFFKEERSAI